MNEYQKFIKKSVKLAIQIRIQGLTAEIKYCRQARNKNVKLHPTEGIYGGRRQLAAAKRVELRTQSRHLMLLYAFVRGVPYRAVEKHAKAGVSYACVDSLAKQLIPFNRQSITEEAFTAWLKAGDHAS